MIFSFWIQFPYTFYPAYIIFIPYSSCSLQRVPWHIVPKSSPLIYIENNFFTKELKTRRETWHGIGIFNRNIIPQNDGMNLRITKCKVLRSAKFILHLKLTHFVRSNCRGTQCYLNVIIFSIGYTWFQLRFSWHMMSIQIANWVL